MDWGLCVLAVWCAGVGGAGCEGEVGGADVHATPEACTLNTTDLSFTPRPSNTVCDASSVSQEEWE